MPIVLCSNTLSRAFSTRESTVFRKHIPLWKQFRTHTKKQFNSVGLPQTCSGPFGFVPSLGSCLWFGAKLCRPIRISPIAALHSRSPYRFSAMLPAWCSIARVFWRAAQNCTISSDTKSKPAGKILQCIQGLINLIYWKFEMQIFRRLRIHPTAARRPRSAAHSPDHRHWFPSFRQSSAVFRQHRQWAAARQTADDVARSAMAQNACRSHAGFYWP